MSLPRISEKSVVLVVEDEPLLRMMAVDLVEDAGFEALEAADADRALIILESRSDVAIVFSDIDMPGRMDGLMLADLTRDRWPSIGIILASGHVHVSEVEVPPGIAFFSKPYDHGQVTSVLRSMAVRK